MRREDRRVALGLYRTGLSREILEAALDLDITAIDTAYNYDQFTSHRALSAIADDLLHRFEISTKVGYFPDGHDLTPARLRQAVERSTEELDRTADTILLHNPEQSADALVPACMLLEQLRDEGWCANWGIASWDPQALSGIDYHGPVPDVLMVRAGLTVPGAVRTAGDALFDATRAIDRWGMAPFGQNTADPLWSELDLAPIVRADHRVGSFEAAFAAAFELPQVSRIAVGTHRADHLAQLQKARLLSTNTEALEGAVLLSLGTTAQGSQEGR